MTRQFIIKKMIMLALVLLFTSLLYFYFSAFVPYIPVIRQPTTPEFYDKPFVLDPTILTKDHKMKMVQILTTYRISFKVEKGVIFIPKELQNDEDLLANYTLKAINFDVDAKLRDW